MILDYVKSTETFKLEVPRGEADPHQIMVEQGLDFWSGSPPGCAILMTKEPYAAAHYGRYATPKALAEIQQILKHIEASSAPTSNFNPACPIDKELMPFQRASIEYALNRTNCLIGDQPGLGKTPIAICYANEIQAKRVLVICPASIRRQWVKRIREWTTLRWPYTVYAIEKGRNGVHPTAEWTVVSYELARTEAIGKALAKGEYDLLIMDEAHYVKNHESRRSRAIFGGGDGALFAPLISRAERTLALTGTPLPNRPREAYTLSRALCWDAIDWASEEGFQKRFNPGGHFEGRRSDGSVFHYHKEEVGRSGELQCRLRANFMVRHLKRDVMPQLKLPVYDIVQVDETGPVKQALAAEKLLDIDLKNLENGDIDPFEGHVAVVRRQMGEAIAPQVAAYARMLIDGGEEKVVIFAWHISVLDILCKELHDLGVLRVDGSTSASAKEKAVEQFQKDPSKQIIVGNTLSLGTGVDGLQHASAHALLAEPDWVSGNNEQAIDRLDRGGQKRTVQADLFVAPGSLTERILHSSLTKMRVVHRTLDAVA